MTATTEMTNWYPPWSPRFWNGMRLPDYLRLLHKNHFRIHPLRYPMTLLVGGCSVINWGLSAIQRLALNRRIEAVQFCEPPIFIIGHWRSGTTLIHELMSLDDRFAFASTYDAFVPSHYLVSSMFLSPIIKLLLPGRRPMDNMSLAMGSPQEDDFALCSLGAPSPYYRMAFPNFDEDSKRQLSFNNLDTAQQRLVREALSYFFKSLTLRYNKQLVLKSPPHTARIQQLSEWFPGAKFIHMARNPKDLVPSTMRLWRLLDQIHGFQLPRYDGRWLLEYVCHCQEIMYDAYFAGRQQLGKNQLTEIQFEHLIADPQAVLKSVYESLQLERFESLTPHIEDYFERRSNLKPARHSMNPQLQPRVDESWSRYRQEFGYATN
jgi:hypothetical protein